MSDHDLPQVSSDETADKLKGKMHDIELKRLEEEVAERAQLQGIPYINLKGFPIAPEALELIPRAIAESTHAICFLFSGDSFRIGAVRTDDKAVAEIRDQIAKEHHIKGSIYAISEESLQHAFKLYDKLPARRVSVKGVAITEADLNKFSEAVSSFKDLQSRMEGLPVTDIVSLMISAALQARASDIHIEAEEKGPMIRFRIDGALIEVVNLPSDVWQKLSSRVKLVAGIKINITAKPQDGRFTITVTGDKIDVRVSTIPTAYGESIVMRLLRSSAVGLAFEDLGIRGNAFTHLSREIERPNGMIITTGPTGSGKTTTLYAVLNKLNKPDVKIITMEDPIEYHLEGIAQSQMDASHDYTFAKGLRSILRQDPDIVMVGEIRDLETAEISIQAALTGHLVLSTIHTNGAAGAIPRFLSMGVKPFLLTPALNAVIGQRLVRKICPDCKSEEPLSDEMLTRAKETLSLISPVAKVQVDLENMHFFVGGGCDKCFGLGYRGRIGIYEIMIMNAEIGKIISSDQVSEYAIQEIAVRDGMVTMAQDGLLKALEGITSVQEVFSVAE